MSELYPGQYGQNQNWQVPQTEYSKAIDIDIDNQSIVEPDRRYEMSIEDIDGVAAMVFEQVATNPDSVSYHIYNVDPAAIGQKVGSHSEAISDGHNYLYGDDEATKHMIGLLDSGVDQARGLDSDDPYARAELLVLQEQPDGELVVGYGLSGRDDAGRPKTDQISFRLSGAAAAMMYAAAEDPVAVDRIVEMAGLASGMPESIYQQNLNPSKSNFSDQVLNVANILPAGSRFRRIKKRPKSSLK